MQEKGIIIAIDGFSACGKSTLAKALANELGYIYIDTGAMYRAVTLYLLRQQVDWNIEADLLAALANVNIAFKGSGDQLTTYLNGENVEREIRQIEVSNHVSPVAEQSAVRRLLVEQQQQMGKDKSIVMDGRDIGTVVFPDAELKLFLTASAQERARRRFEELKAKGEEISLAAIADNLSTRDHIDSTREDSPLTQAQDAVLLDNTNINQAEQLAMVLALAKQRSA